MPERFRPREPCTLAATRLAMGVLHARALRLVAPLGGVNPLGTFRSGARIRPIASRHATTALLAVENRPFLGVGDLRASPGSRSRVGALRVVRTSYTGSTVVPEALVCPPA